MEQTEKENRSKELFLTVWFLALLLLPVLLPLILSDKDLFEVLVDWLVHVGESLLLAFIIKIIISYVKKTRPRFSIDTIFLTIATAIYLLHITILGDVLQSNANTEDRNTGTVNYNAASISYSATNASQIDDLEELMIAVRDKVNQYCPMNIGQGLMLRNVGVFPDHVFSFNYFFIEYTIQDLRETGFAFSEEDKRQLVNSVRTNPDIAVLRDKGVTFWYRFHDNELNYFDKIVVTKEDYNQPPEKMPSKFSGFPKGLRYDIATPVDELQDIVPYGTLIDYSATYKIPCYMIFHPCNSEGLEGAIKNLVGILDANKLSFDKPYVRNERLSSDIDLTDDFNRLSTDLQNGEAEISRVWKLEDDWGIIWIANHEECSIGIMQSKQAKNQ